MTFIIDFGYDGIQSHTCSLVICMLFRPNKNKCVSGYGSEKFR